MVCGGTMWLGMPVITLPPQDVLSGKVTMAGDGQLVGIYGRRRLHESFSNITACSAHSIPSIDRTNSRYLTGPI